MNLLWQLVVRAASEESSVVHVWYTITGTNRYYRNDCCGGYSMVEFEGVDARTGKQLPTDTTPTPDWQYFSLRIDMDDPHNVTRAEWAAVRAAHGF